MLSKYEEIYRDLAQKIETGTYKANQLLPSEKQLIDYYGASRDTVRKALNLMSQNGLILKVKGKGSFVLDNHQLNFDVSNVVTFKEVSQQAGHDFKTNVESLLLETPKEELRKTMGIPLGEKMWHLIRTRVIDGEKVILDKDYIVKRYADTLTETVAQNSLYEYLEQEQGLKIAYARKEIVVEMATKDDQNYLDLYPYEMVAVVRSYTYLEDMTMFQYTESRHRPDKFKFVDFAKR